MIARKFIRLNFDGDVFFITDIRRTKFTISEKEFDSGELDEMCFVCNKTGRMYSTFTINRNYVYSFAHKVSVHFLYCMNYSKKLFKYHEKNIRKISSLPFPPNNFKIYFVYCEVGEHMLSAFIHADSESEAKEKIKAYIQEQKKLHPRKYKNLDSNFKIICEI